jgi:hypothetical protein
MLLGPPIPSRVWARCRTKADTLALHVGGWVWGLNPHLREAIARKWVQALEEKKKKNNNNEKKILFHLGNMIVARQRNPLIQWTSLHFLVLKEWENRTYFLTDSRMFKKKANMKLCMHGTIKACKAGVHKFQRPGLQDDYVFFTVAPNKSSVWNLLMSLFWCLEFSRLS